MPYLCFLCSSSSSSCCVLAAKLSRNSCNLSQLDESLNNACSSTKLTNFLSNNSTAFRLSVRACTLRSSSICSSANSRLYGKQQHIKRANMS